jgi:hypothetical protein
MTGHGQTLAIARDDDVALPRMHSWARWNQEIKAKQLVVAPPCFGHRSIAGDDFLWRCTSANMQSRPTEGSTINYGAPEMQRLTRRLMRCLAASIVDGNEHNLADSDEILQKGILKLARCNPPLDALLLQDDPQSKALLPDHLLELEVVSDSSMVMNSDEVFGELGENREEERGTEAELGFGGGVGLLIGYRGRRHESWRWQWRCWRHRAVSVDPEVEDDGLPDGFRLPVHTESVC